MPLYVTPTLPHPGVILALSRTSQLFLLSLKTAYSGMETRESRSQHGHRVCPKGRRRLPAVRRPRLQLFSSQWHTNADRGHQDAGGAVTLSFGSTILQQHRL